MHPLVWTALIGAALLLSHRATSVEGRPLKRKDGSVIHVQEFHEFVHAVGHGQDITTAGQLAGRVKLLPATPTPPSDVAAAVSITVSEGERFLLPVLPFNQGPHGQLFSIREALVLGRLLQRTVLLPDPLVHKKGGDVPTMSAIGPQTELPLDFMVDVPRLQASQPVHLLRSWLVSGRDIKLDASVRLCAADECVSAAENDKLQFGDAGQASVMLRWGRDRVCTAEGWKARAEELRPFRVVGVMTHRDVVPHASAAAGFSSDGCLSAFHDVQSHLHRSDQIRAAAALFMRVHLGGDEGNFAALHLQPHPEKCMAVWRSRPFDAALAGQACGNDGLHSQLAQKVHESMAVHQLTHLFVICHSDILESAKALLLASPPGQPPRTGALSLQYLSLDLLEVYRGWRLASAQAMVNAEVAETARLFLGTRGTALTVAIEQGRAARRAGPDSTVLLPQGV